MPAQPSRFRRHVTVLAIYVLLSLLLTLPLLFRFTTHVPGDGIDDPALAWNLWWLKHSLIDRQINPFDSQWMFYPIGINLAFYTLTIWNGLLSIPLQTAFSVVIASNLLLLSSFVLSGYGAYLLCLEVLRSLGDTRSAKQRQFMDGAAFLGGLLYAFSSSKLFYASLGQFNIASSQWIPFAVLYTLRSVRSDARLREPLLAAIFILLQAYAELTYAAFLGIFVALVAIWRVLQLIWPAGQDAVRQRRQDSLRLLRNLVVIAIVFGVGLTPVLANMLPDMRAEGDFLVEGEGFADVFSADLAGYALPTQLHPLLGNIIVAASDDSALHADGSQWQVNKGQHLTLGILGLGLAIAGVWTHRRRRDTWFWVTAAVVFFLLTLGPSVRWMGDDTGIPGPFRLLQNVPFLKGNRYPSRFSVMLLVSIAPLVALGSGWVLSKLAMRPRASQLPRRAALIGTAALAAILVFENLSAPLPLADMQTPAIYDVIAAEPGDFAVLDLPAGWRNGFSTFGKQDLVIMSEQWWQTSHGKPILGGNTSRNPEFKFRYFLDAPLIGPLTILGNVDEAHPHIVAQMADELAALDAGTVHPGDDSLLGRAAADARDVLEALNVRFIVVHRDHVPLEFTQFVEQFLPVTLVDEDGEHALYRVENEPPASELLITPATNSLARGEGWSGQGFNQVNVQTAWAQRRETVMFTPSLAPGSYAATLAAVAAGPDQTLRLVINGVATAAQPLPTEWSELRFDLPPDALSQGINELVLRFDRTFPTESLVGASEPTVNLLVESAGLEAGNYAHIWLNGRDISLNQRGYNLAIVDSTTGEVLAVDSFDTHSDPTASDGLVRFLQQVKPGQLLAVAIKDTASDQLSEQAAQTLSALGLTDMRGKFRWAQAAIVAMEETTPPVVTEDVDGLQAAAVGIGAGWREPNVAAQVDWLRLERQQN